MKKVLIIPGSFRKKSFNRQLAMLVKELLDKKAEVSFLEFADLPFMDQDIEFPAPESVARVRRAVTEADGIWICSPEYNHQIPGGLKNLLDWLSRPIMEGDRKSSSAAKGRLVTISSAAGKEGGADVRDNLNKLLERMGMSVVGGTGTGIALFAEAFASDELIVPDERMEALKAQAEEFLAAL